MAVKTKFTKEDMKVILSPYDLGDFCDIKPIENGAVQTNYLLITTKGRYIFRYYENRSKHSVLFEVNLLQYLKDKKYPCPAPFKSKHGESVGIYNNRPFVFFEFMGGEHIENPNEEQKKELIQKAAELQNLTRGYIPVYKEYRWNYGVDLCRKLAENEAARINTLNAKEKLIWYDKELSRLNLPDSLPKGICHCDFHFSNVLFKNGEFSALIDFDDANYTYLIYDLICLMNPFIPSFTWNTWDRFKAADNVFDFTETTKVVFHYMKYRPLNDDEKRHLFDVYKLSILIDCIWFFERGNARDFYEKRKIDYLNALGREGFYENIFRSL